GSEAPPRLRPVAARVRLLAEPVVGVGDDAAARGPEPFHRRGPRAADLVEDAKAVVVHPGSGLAHATGMDAIAHEHGGAGTRLRGPGKGPPHNPGPLRG